jgi:hypothetical protein
MDNMKKITAYVTSSGAIFADLAEAEKQAAMEEKQAKVHAFMTSDACKYKSKPHRAIVESVINGWIDWNAK